MGPVGRVGPVEPVKQARWGALEPVGPVGPVEPEPTKDYSLLEHLLMYVSGTKGLVQRLRPGMTLSGLDCNLDLICYVHSDYRLDASARVRALPAL